MAINSIQNVRVSNLMQSNSATQSISRTQQQLMEVQNELTTQKRINNVSDDPGTAAIIEQLQKTLQQRQGFSDNLQQATSHLGEVDSTLGDMSDLLQQAQSIASANVGSSVTDAERKSAAVVVNNLYNQMLSLANKQYGGMYLFGGDQGGSSPFVEKDGGVQFVGSGKMLQNAYDENTVLPFTVDGARLFGAMSGQVQGTADLTPQLSNNTRLMDLGGATTDGVHPGIIRIGNGSTFASVDLTQADTVGDVVNTINSTLHNASNNAAFGNVSVAVGADGKSFRLSTTGSDDLTVQEVGGGAMAADLGLLRLTGAGSGAAVSGGSVQPRVTALTKLTDLAGGSALDLSSGITITNGSKTATIKFTSPPLPTNPTVQDMLNAINGSGTNVLARINDAGTGIDVINPTQGVQMTIGENGGTTAAALGIRSFNPQTTLASLNFGQGVRTVSGADISISPSDATRAFDVDLSNLNTVQDVINAINAASGGAVTAGFATSGNGITITDNTSGSGTLTLTAKNASNAAADLGLLQPASGGKIQGTDVNPAESQGIFSNLAKLRDSLQSGDQAAITAAASGLQDDYNRTVLTRGEAGARLQGLQSRQTRLEDENVATKSLLSSLQDVDFTDAVTRFQTLQTALQASLQANAKILNLSLMDFLS